MLSKEQLNEIKEHLERAQNPVFFFDNDVDGLISFILLRRFTGRGKGVAIKSFPELDESYIRKVEEFNADYVFVLDKPGVSKGFIEEMEKKSIPIVWIDHHDVKIDLLSKNVYYFNPIFAKEKSSEPVSYICYKVADVHQDKWLALIGCIYDNFIPEFLGDIAKDCPSIINKNAKSAFEIFYENEFGKLIMMLDFGLKDRTTNVVSMINVLLKAQVPFDLLKEDESNYKIHRRYQQVNIAYSNLLERAKRVARGSGKVVFFQYGGELSLSSNIANELSYRFPGKVVIVAYIKGAIANVSIRGSVDVRDLTIKAIEKIGNATGGGHKHATGAKMMVEDLEKFKNFFERNAR